jgi:hypothetical protein
VLTVYDDSKIDGEVIRDQWPAEPNGDRARGSDLDRGCQVFQKLLAIVQLHFSPTHRDAFRRLARDGLPAARVAPELHLT